MQFVVTYNSLQEFKDMVNALDLEGPLPVRVCEREQHHSHRAGTVITHCVFLQARIGDEIHLCKFVGRPYDYWGKQFSDHAQLREAGMDWSSEMTYRIRAFCAHEGYVEQSGFYWMDKLEKVPGVTMEVEHAESG